MLHSIMRICSLFSMKQRAFLLPLAMCLKIVDLLFSLSLFKECLFVQSLWEAFVYGPCLELCLIFSLKEKVLLKRFKDSAFRIKDFINPKQLINQLSYFSMVLKALAVRSLFSNFTSQLDLLITISSLLLY